MNPLHRRLKRLEAVRKERPTARRFFFSVVRKGHEEEDEARAFAAEQIERVPDDFTIRIIGVRAQDGGAVVGFTPSAWLAA